MSNFERMLYDCGKNGESFSFPYIGLKGLILKIQRLVKVAQNLNKNPAKQRNVIHRQKLQKFEDMFDIFTCNCYDKKKQRAECRCSVRIPEKDWEAFVGQKLRKTQLGSLDRAANSIKKRSMARKEKGESKIER